MIECLIEMLEAPDGVFEEFFEYTIDSLVIDTSNRLSEEFVEYHESYGSFIDAVRYELNNEFIVLYTGGFVEN